MAYMDTTARIVGAAFEVHNATGLSVGMLVNFGRERVDYKRMVL